METRKTGVKSTKKNEKCKTQKGITLIALVITIIVLLILAGVGINMAINSEGLFAHANKAVTEWNEGVAKEQEAIGNILEKADEITWVRPEFKEEDITLDEADAQRTGDYGKLVEGYQSTGEGLGEKKWRLFYQDSKYTYLIMNELGEEVTLAIEIDEKYKEEPDEYKNGATVSTIGKKLNKGLLDATRDEFFTYTTEADNENIMGTKWLTDKKNWEAYTDTKDGKKGDVEYAIGAPTADLFAASYNSNTNTSHVRYKKGTITLIPGDNGYDIQNIEGDNWFNQEDSYGIYNTGKRGRGWWIASPEDRDSSVMIILDENGESFGQDYVVYSVPGTYSIRPVVCIQTVVFERGIEKGKYTLKDE